MKHVTDAMQPDVLVVDPETSVRELARSLLERDAIGACVVEGDELVGVVTEMDLVFQEKRVHLPTVIAFMDALIPLDLGGRSRHELEKIAGVWVKDIMSRDVFTAAPTDPLDGVVARMIDEHLSYVPVVDGGRIVGVVTRRSLLATVAA